ncbi:reverse transcriptase domain-containing protein [Tanacetum coccineum]
MSITAIERLISQCVADALLHFEANRNSGNGNGNGNDNGNGSHDSGSGDRRTLHTAHGCTYKEFLNCQPLNFKRIEGAVGLVHWFKKMEFVFYISNCTIKCQVKYETCTLLGGALTWWSSYVRTVGHDVAYGMPWKTLMKIMTEAYCLRSRIKKLETELWNLTVKGSVMASNPKILQEAIELARSLMDQKVRAYAARQADNKRRMENNPRDNHVQQPPYKRNCKRIGHQTMDCRSLAAATNQRALMANQRTLTCFECGEQGHYRSECPKLKSRNLGNQAGSSEARRRVYALGGGETDQDPSNIADDIDALKEIFRILSSET